MPTYIAFLRALNVGGRFARMADLRAGLNHKGFGEVESYIQSGNLRFTSSLQSANEVELALGTALEELCGFTVRTIVRTPAQLGELASYGAGLAAPWEGEARRYVTFLAEDPDADFVAMMNGWDVAGERAGEAQQRADRARGSGGDHPGLEGRFGVGGDVGRLTHARPR